MTQNPPRAAGNLLQWLHRRTPTPWGKDPRDYNPRAIQDLYTRYGRLFEAGRYFQTEHRGWEHVPEAPVMIVSNHSGGTLLLDVFGFLEGWYRRFGVDRPLHPLAHEMLFSNRVTGPWMSQRGILHADKAIAHDALVGHRHDIMVLPGGDHDAWRPFHKRYEVCFAGRTGYARLALETGVAIVPVAHTGAHHTMIVLTDGRRFARAIGLHAFARADTVPVHLSLPWGIGIGGWPHFPLPTRLRYRIGPPVPPPEQISPGEEPDHALVREYSRRVQAAVQRLLDELRAQ